MRRREFLGLAAGGGTAIAVGSVWPRLFQAAAAGPGPYGDLLAADANGLELPAGFSSRVIATTGQVVPGTGYTWHVAPDGGATFPTGDGGWIYVANSEVGSSGGGAGMVRFSSSGAIVDARRILASSSNNCAGGATPWGTWLSCEENSTGRVWECDPTGVNPAVARPAMGLFPHEAAAVDPAGHAIYLTEDQPDGALYRFLPTTWQSLSTGTLQVLTEAAGVLTWRSVPDPDGSPTATRNQLANTKRFNGGEGAWFHSGKLYFTTKGDNRVWNYTPVTNTLSVLYDKATSPTPVLSGVDNVTVSQTGDAFVAEDGGNMEIVILAADGTIAPFLRLPNVTGSELTGVAFDPSGSRLYFSSQRSPGRTYEVSGPFRTIVLPTTSTTGTTVPPTAIELSAVGKKVKNKRQVTLTWTGATGASVDVIRNGAKVITTANDGTHVDQPPTKGTTTFVYTVCNADTSTCSPPVTVQF